MRHYLRLHKCSTVLTKWEWRIKLDQSSRTESSFKSCGVSSKENTSYKCVCAASAADRDLANAICCTPIVDHAKVDHTDRIVKLTCVMLGCIKDTIRIWYDILQSQAAYPPTTTTTTQQRSLTCCCLWARFSLHVDGVAYRSHNLLDVRLSR